jgi:hypothetical protein
VKTDGFRIPRLCLRKAWGIRRCAYWNWDRVGGSSKGLADSNDEPSKKLADTDPALSLIKSEDRPFEKARRTEHPESQRLCQPPLGFSELALQQLFEVFGHY